MNHLTPVPEDYRSAIAHGGTIAKIDYETTDRLDRGKKVAKYAYVYLPYGYSASKPYDILYCLHGGGGEIEVFFGTEEHPADIKLTLDHMIANGDIEPIIAVSPTYYAHTREHDLGSAVEEIEFFCKHELISDLIPAVEGKFRTYAGSTNPADIRLSRRHRAYTGYSMGSLSTWYSFIHDLEYFYYFMPMSGDCWTDGRSDAKKAADTLDLACESRGYTADDFLLCAITGDQDIAYERMKNQVEAMKSSSDYFRYTKGDSPEGNFRFYVEPGATHDYKYMPLYFYNVLPLFWK